MNTDPYPDPLVQIGFYFQKKNISWNPCNIVFFFFSRYEDHIICVQQFIIVKNKTNFKRINFKMGKIRYKSSYFHDTKTKICVQQFSVVKIQDKTQKTYK